MKQTTKVLLSAALTIALCVSVISGATFALFTDKAETNIVVSAGKVDVDAGINNIQTWSLEDDKTAEGRTDGTFTQGGSATFENGTLTLDRIIPGDKVAFDVAVENESNVAIQYRYKIACTEGKELMSGLALSIGADTYESIYSYTSAWKKLGAFATIDPIKVSIELPVEAGNKYQDLSTRITVTVEAIQGNAETTGDEQIIMWDGTADTSWYNETDTEFTLTSAEQFAGFATLVDGGETFKGKTIKLEGDLNLASYDENGEAICFNPIGSYRQDSAFQGTFDGQGYTISDMNQNTWALNNGYYYADLGLGLFGKVEDATIKNLTMDSANISGESALVGIVAAAAYGDCIFENITVQNSKGADYQYYAGGIVGWASGNHQYINCDVDETTTIATQWGDFDNSTGGIIGGCGGSATILLKDCDVACRIDSYNDVTSSYRWYAYRRAGMLIGNTGTTTVVDKTTYASAPQLTCENVTVTYGEWADYHYCEFAGQNWPYVRVEAGISNSAYSNPRYGHPIDANGNEVVDNNHVHNEGEDHMILCVFDQLYGGGQGVYGTASHDGVTVIYNNDKQ